MTELEKWVKDVGEGPMMNRLDDLRQAMLMPGRMWEGAYRECLGYLAALMWHDVITQSAWHCYAQELAEMVKGVPHV